jgi:Recombination endonuclease VII
VPNGHKWCPDCATVKPLDDFVRHAGMPSGRAPYCKPCHNVRGKASKERAGGSRKYHLKRRYGITVEEADLMLERQSGLCAICRTAPATQVDHDHETSAVRALLCFNCNGGLGQFRDDPAVLRAAADYVEEHRRRQRPQQLRTRRDELTVRPAARRRSGPRSAEVRRSPMCTLLQAHLDALART